MRLRRPRKQMDDARNDLREPSILAILAFEAGYKACERGENIQYAIEQLAAQSQAGGKRRKRMKDVHASKLRG